MRIDEKYQYETTPKANEKAIIKGDKYRFTVLTSRLIRIEYNEDGYFEDRATQTVVNRVFDVPEFEVLDTDSLLTITTEHFILTYTKQPFSPNSLFIEYTGKNVGMMGNVAAPSTWNYGDIYGTLDGTTRTLDGKNGECPLEKSIMSRGKVTILDDSKSLIICEDGWIEPRTNPGIDQYLFCYGDYEKAFDYKACLRDFYALTGKTPMLPRYALGNWWSRYYDYTQEEYTELMKKFKAEDIPFSVAVIDMDWHITEVDPEYGSGWTGYTWNKDLFPDHIEFLNFLHREGLKTTLNLHPQFGVAPHEKQYKAMAEAMGVDPESKKRIPFEIENPKFVENYFKHLHRPLEDEGVDFWWMDWQQGNTTKIPGLDPLWMLNHFHYIDNCRDNKRGLMFSRYAGPGSHRYPTGFSGDTVVSWESLDFQPYFTICASNIGYGWWSHDIGAHFLGYRDEELETRWYQFGTFSPINRLHSSKTPFLKKEPWTYNKISEISMKKFLKLRHELIPYLYTMNYRAAEQNEPLIEPLYYNWNTPEAYTMKNEYTFGSEFLVAPITKPHDSVTTMGSSEVYLPDGIWYDFFNNRKYEGRRTITMFRDMYEMPAFVKAGGIIPMAKLTHINDIENPENMKIKVFAGADNSFTLYEDDGETTSYKNGAFATTKMSLTWSNNPSFVIEKPQGDSAFITANRNFDIEFIGIEDADSVIVKENGINKPFKKESVNGVLTISVEAVSDKLEIILGNIEEYKPDITEQLFDIIGHFENFPNRMKDKIAQILYKKYSTLQTINELIQLDIDKNALLSIIEILTACDYK